jgi:hypothetical protein
MGWYAVVSGRDDNNQPCSHVGPCVDGSPGDAINAAQSEGCSPYSYTLYPCVPSPNRGPQPGPVPGETETTARTWGAFAVAEMVLNNGQVITQTFRLSSASPESAANGAANSVPPVFSIVFIHVY